MAWERVQRIPEPVQGASDRRRENEDGRGE